MSETCGRTFNFVYLHSQERNVKNGACGRPLTNKQDYYCVNTLQAPALSQLNDSASQLTVCSFLFQTFTQAVCFKLYCTCYVYT